MKLQGSINPVYNIAGLQFTLDGNLYRVILLSCYAGDKFVINYDSCSNSQYRGINKLLLVDRLQYASMNSWKSLIVLLH